MPAVKAHIANSPSPLKEHFEIKAACEVIVPNAYFLHIWDAKKVPERDSEEWRGVCRECRKKELPEAMVYIIVDGNQARTKWKNFEHREG